MPAPAKAAIVVLNAGSSSVKFAAFACDMDGGGVLIRLVHGEIDGIGRSAQLLAWTSDGTPLLDDGVLRMASGQHDHAQALRLLFEWLERQLPQRSIVAVAHRVVHGGEHFTKPVLVTQQVLAQLDALSPLAPLHQPHNLEAIRVIARLEPALTQVACFDTAFHAGQQWAMQAYALPRRIREAGVRRYGFHGLSYEYIAGQLPTYLGAQADARVIVAHLGNGASMCGLLHRRSVATTMGFTALEGLMMGTRCGHLDPGAVMYLGTAMGMSMAEIERLLYQESGLLGVSEISSDMRALQASNDPRAQAAIDLFVHHIGRELGSLAAALQGIDALVFTAGIGEHSAQVRQRVCSTAAWLGVELDEQVNSTLGAAQAVRISTDRSRVSVWVIPTNEEWMLAQHAQTLLLS